MITLKNCPICGSNDFTPALTCVDYTVSHETFSLDNCNTCKFLFTNPRPSDQELSRYYESKNYISHSNSTDGYFNKIYQAIRKSALKNKKTLIKKFLDKGTLLDIGCGTGEFLNHMKNSGWAVKGIEPNASAREQAKLKYRLDIAEEIIPTENNQFDVVTMWHVLEHVSDLQERINRIRNVLNNKGILIIAVPNYTSWDAKHYNEYWAAYDVPRHLSHFSPNVIKRLLGGKGFAHIKSLPMKFDSFYVSMLSEKYKKNKFSFIRGLWNGYLSNLRATTSEDYSSVIYVFKKN